MPNPVILAIHGIGNHHSDLTWQDRWRSAIQQAVFRFNPNITPDIVFPALDPIFDEYPLGALDYVSAILKLGRSGISAGLSSLFRRSRGISSGFAEVSETVRWTAGMVVQWTDDAKLRQRLRAAVSDEIKKRNPSLILAHSLGSLVGYDTLQQLPKYTPRLFASFGSQIGNPFVRSSFGGRIDDLPGQTAWRHLFNDNDRAFTSPIRLSSDRFAQIDTEFDVPGALNHDALAYLSHRATDSLWELATSFLSQPASRSLTRSVAASAAKTSKTAKPARTTSLSRTPPREPTRKALLIGINDYPNPADQLDGCVNDVFLVSSVLQESGFAPEHIRVVLNDRATASGIMERLEWLLGDARSGDIRFLYYSGHGAQIPAYGPDAEVDHVDECLVPYDFNWSASSAITDDQFYELYSQLPFDASFTTVFDCCHSGGMTRHGGARVRGLTPPDDIRHRALEWVPDLQMWRERKLPQTGRALNVDKGKRAAYLGESGSLYRLGRAVPLRGAPARTPVASASAQGPFLPVIYQACQESQLAYEYKHGAIPHGAFTFAMCKIFREAKAARRPLTFNQILDRTAKTLTDLEFDQTPCLVAPTKVRSSVIPWLKRPK